MSKLLLFTGLCSIWSCFAEPLSRPTINNGADRVAVRVPAALHHNSCIFAVSSGSWSILSMTRVSHTALWECLNDECLLEAIWWRVVSRPSSPTPTVHWARKENTLPKIKMSFPLCWKLTDFSVKLEKSYNRNWTSWNFWKTIRHIRLSLHHLKLFKKHKYNFAFFLGILWSLSLVEIFSAI